MSDTRIVACCESCGATPPPDAEKSTANWTVYPTVCPKDGARVSLKLKE